MLVGIDFDNTIVCYDELFHRVATERGLLDEPVAATKGTVRDYLRRTDREPCWTELQGYVYGPGIVAAAPFPGVLDFFARCRRRGIRCIIVSHKTRTPFAGPPYDLHAAAHRWLAAQGLYDAADSGIARDGVFLELTKEAKLERIGRERCDLFIDDLPELLSEPTFPADTRRILFSPAGDDGAARAFPCATSWSAITEMILSEASAPR